MSHKIPQQAVKRLNEKNSTFSKQRALKAANELARRQIDALALYVPQPHQEEFHACTAKERMVQGGNRAGKSLVCFAEDARAVRGLDPHNKYPKRDGVLAIVGYKEWHVGNVIYPYLFKAGAFKIIRDEETGLWRVYRPWVPQDRARIEEAKPAPPLIPPREIEKMVWKDRAKQIFSNVYLKSGWEIKAFSSSARPDQGYQADLIHIDEDVINPMWYEEAAGRLIDRKGKFIWSALPHDDNDAIARFAERAEYQQQIFEERGKKPSSVVVRMTLDENPYLDQEDKDVAIAGWKSMGEDVYRKRALGELVTDSVMMYPMWRRSVHDVRQYKDQITEIDEYFKNDCQIPLHWCRRLCVDPGHKIGAALFIATPPSAEFHLIYDEIYASSCTSAVMATALYEKTKRTFFQNFIVDAHGGNLTSIDTGVSPREAYEREMSLRGVRCIETGSRFLSGCDKIQYREEITRSMLLIGSRGYPKLIADLDRCPALDTEMKRFRKKRVNGVVTDTGNRRQYTHLVECMEYLAVFLNDSFKPYIKPKGSVHSETEGQRRVRMHRQRTQERQMADNPFGITSTIILGPQGVY